METLKVNSKYLVKSRFKNLIELTVLEITEKAIKVKYEYGTPSWLLKEDFDYTIIEELPTVKQIIEDKSHEIQVDDDMWCEKDEPQFTLKITDEKDIEVKLKVEEKLKLEWYKYDFEPMTWDEADKYAKSLGDGWRLPTPEELKDFTLIEDKNLSFWTSLEGVRTSTVFYLKHGSMSSVFKKNKIPTVFVRETQKETVREPFWEIRDLKEVQEKSALSDDYNLGLYNGMELCLSLLEKREPKYKDIKKPKLEWEQIPSKNPMTWEEAMEYAKSLGDGWRLPTIEELEEAYNNKIVEFQSYSYWSSSKYAKNTNFGWYVSFYYGLVNSYFKTYTHYVRCVREVK